MAEDIVLPRQTLTFLHLALRQLKSRYDAGEEAKAAGTKAYADMAEASAKKSKTAM